MPTRSDPVHVSITDPLGSVVPRAQARGTCSDPFRLGSDRAPRSRGLNCAEAHIRPRRGARHCAGVSNIVEGVAGNAPRSQTLVPAARSVVGFGVLVTPRPGLNVSSRADITYHAPPYPDSGIESSAGSTEFCRRGPALVGSTSNWKSSLSPGRGASKRNHDGALSVDHPVRSRSAPLSAASCHRVARGRSCPEPRRASVVPRCGIHEWNPREPRFSAPSVVRIAKADETKPPIRNADG